MKRDLDLPYPPGMPARFPVDVIALGHRCYRQRNDRPPRQYNRRAVH